MDFKAWVEGFRFVLKCFYKEFLIMGIIISICILHFYLSHKDMKCVDFFGGIWLKNIDGHEYIVRGNKIPMIHSESCFCKIVNEK